MTFLRCSQMSRVLYHSVKLIAIEQGTQVSMATQRAAITTRHCHTDKLSGVYLSTCILTMASQEGGKGRGKLPHKCTNTSSKLHDFQSEYASSNAKQRPVCWIGPHAPRTPLTSIGSILTLNINTQLRLLHNFA